MAPAAFARNQPYSRVEAAVQTALNTFTYGPAAGGKPAVDGVIVTIAAASQILSFQDQNGTQTTLTFPLTGVFILPISPASIITGTTTAAQVLVAYC